MGLNHSKSTAKVTAALKTASSQPPNVATFVDDAQFTQHNKIHGTGALLSSPEERKSIPFAEPPVKGRKKLQSLMDMSVTANLDVTEMKINKPR